MSPKANFSHDISFLRQDLSTEVGLMLASDPKTGKKKYAEVSDPTLAQQFFTGVPDLGHLPPEKEIQIGQDDWRSGFGQEYFSGADEKRYYKSIKADARFKNMIIGGPLAATITHSAPSTPILVDGGMELWNNGTLTHWTFVETESSVTLAKEASIKHSGQYSAKLSFTDDSNADGHICQNLPWDDKYRGGQIRVTAFVRSEGTMLVLCELSALPMLRLRQCLYPSLELRLSLPVRLPPILDLHH